MARLIERVLNGQEIESELGRVRAYRRCMRYAEEHLAESRLCNEFLFRSAELLQQAPMALPVVFNRVPLPSTARTSFYYSDDDGPVLVGNRDGLRYLSGLCGELAESPVPGESIFLDPEFDPFVGDSESLTIFLEEDSWFEAVVEGREGELSEQWEAEIESRILSPEQIAALQLGPTLPPGLALSPNKLYRVLGLSPFAPTTTVPRKWLRQTTDRVMVFTLRDDEGELLELAIDLDDDEVAFYYPWHLEQLVPEWAQPASQPAQPD